MSDIHSPIKAKQIIIGDLFTRFIFVIPKFQRPFSWTVENFKKLFTDIYDAMKDGQEAYFLGSMFFGLMKTMKAIFIKLLMGNRD